MYETGVEDMQDSQPPEEAAVASFPVTTQARVMRTEELGPTRVDVIVDTVPTHPMRVHCEKIGNLWYEAGDIVE